MWHAFLVDVHHIDTIVMCVSKNNSELGVIFTNLAIQNGGPTLDDN
jgi:hypothetical protein